MRSSRPALALLLLAAARAAAETTPEPPGDAPPSAADDVPGFEAVVVAPAARADGPGVRVRDRADIARPGGDSLASVLEREPGLFATTGGRGERILTLRGFDQRGTAVLVDGAPAALPYDGQLDTGMLPAAMVDRLVVAAGAGSVAMGPGGLGGTVDVVTRRPGEGALLEGAVGAGPRGAAVADVAHALKKGRFAWTLYGGLSRRDAWALPAGFAPTPLQPAGARLNSDRRVAYAGASAEAAPGARHRLTLAGWAVDGARGVPPNTVDDRPQYWRFNDWRVLALSVGHRGRAGRFDLDDLVYVRRYDNLLDAYDDATFRTQQTARAMHSWYHDTLAGARVRGRAAFEAPWGRTTARLWTGAQYDRHEKDQAGDAFRCARVLGTVAGEAEARLAAAWGLRAALQADLELPVELPGGRVAPALGPMLSVRWAPHPTLALSPTVARRTRFPTLKERFSASLGTRLPNPALGPETALHLGLDAAWRPRERVQLQASLHDAEVAGLIERVLVEPGLDQLRNLERARMAGSEWLASVRAAAWLRLSAGYAFLHARGEDGPLEYRPAHKGFVEVEGGPWRGLRGGVSLHGVGARPYENPETRRPEALEPYLRLDARVEWRPLPWLGVWARATNLLDAAVHSERGYPEPGREVLAGLTFGAGDRPPAEER